MEKILVEVTGEFSFCDNLNPEGPVSVLPGRPYVINKTTAASFSIAANNLRVLSAELKDDADDETFYKFFVSEKNNKSQAVEKFLKKYGKNVKNKEEKKSSEKEQEKDSKASEPEKEIEDKSEEKSETPFLFS